MAANLIYIAEGTAKVFKASGGDVVWTPQNVASGSGRISAVLDLGASPRPRFYKWEACTKWAATATAGDQARFYIVRASASATAANTDGGQTFGDATITSETVNANNSLYLGAVISNGVSQAESSHGVVEIVERYLAVFEFNAAASKALTNTAGDHVFTLTPIPDQIQAAA